MPARARRARRPTTIGLALAGGGPEGAVYEIGALRALEEAFGGLDLTKLDVYVGVSAGAFVAANLVNGVTPAQMVRAMVKHQPGEHPFAPSVFFTPAYGEWARRALTLPALAARALRHLTTEPADQTTLEAFTRLTRILPVGLFDNEPIRRYIAQTFRRTGRTDDFRRLKRRFIVVSADLASGKAIRFGEPPWDHVPISVAVQASTAVPGLYAPVVIDGHYCVDGVLLRTVHASIALERGADLLLCVNPLVPADLYTPERLGLVKQGTLVRRGLPTVLAQAVRMVINSRMVVGMATYAKRFPNADVLLFQPSPSDYGMFFVNMFSFAARKRVVQLAYAATRRDLLARREELEPALARHGIRLDLDVLRDETRTVWDGVGLGDGTATDAAGQLNHALDRLSALIA